MTRMYARHRGRQEGGSIASYDLSSSTPRRLWLLPLANARITQSGADGYVVASMHGAKPWFGLTSDAAERLVEGSFCFIDGYKY